MRRVLLVSSSATYGTGYLDHCEAEIRRLFGSREVRRVLFVPYALFDRAGYADTVRLRFQKLDLEIESIHAAAEPVRAAENAEAIFIGGGNTFRLLKALYDQNLIEPIRDRVLSGTPYLGSSAGSNVACPTIMTTNDMPIVYPPSFEALGLVPFQINAHYLDPDPRSTHKGETRDTRLREYHEENPLPVVALREGAMLVVEGRKVRLAGEPGGRLFRPGGEPMELRSGERVDGLLGAELGDQD